MGQFGQDDDLSAFHKASCLRHLEGVHKFTKEQLEVARAWVATTDGYAVGNGNAHRMRLEFCFDKRRFVEGGGCVPCAPGTLAIEDRAAGVAASTGPSGDQPAKATQSTLAQSAPRPSQKPGLQNRCSGKLVGDGARLAPKPSQKPGLRLAPLPPAQAQEAAQDQGGVALSDQRPGDANPNVTLDKWLTNGPATWLGEARHSSPAGSHAQPQQQEFALALPSQPARLPHDLAEVPPGVQPQQSAQAMLEAL